MRYKRVLKILIIMTFFVCFCTILTNKVYAGTLSSDINGINESKYPGFKSKIQSLQSKYGNYNFKVYYTGIDWAEAVNMEYQGHGTSPKNLFSASSNYKGKWYCPICGSKTFDTGWYCASIDAIKYMMDPRNSLDETSVYQFKSLETPDASSDNIQAIINSKYASYFYINNPTAINAIINASNTYNMNGYSILAKIINEQGRGTSVLATGAGYNGQYVGYYNFFNVGAYGNGTSTVLLNGLKYAYNKGWDSVEKTILGGSEYYKSQYIGRGQNTLYYQRFNVVYEAALFSHQYQQDIMGAQTSAKLLKSYYTTSNTLTSVPHEFIIPIYENMPATACQRPSTTEENDSDFIEATVITNKLPVKATLSGGRVISYLNKNEKVKIVEKATGVSSDGNYWDIIVSTTNGTYGYVNRSGIVEELLSLPSYVFDYKYYADTNPDIKAEFGYEEQLLIRHFIQYGIKEGRVSSPTFSLAYYLQENGDVKAAYGNDYKKVYEQYVNYGCKEYRKTSPEYDGTFYKYYYSDLTKRDSTNLMEHYIICGKSEGRIATIDTATENIVFDAKLYADVNSDVRAVYGYDYFNLRKHWIANGISENRISSLVFNPGMYKQLNSDLNAAYGNNHRQLFEHFIKCGINEGRASSYVFNVNAYLSVNGDIKAAYGNDYKKAMIHFINYGIKENRATSFNFNLNTYIIYNGDLNVAYGTNYREYYIHYLLYGINENRKVI